MRPAPFLAVGLLVALLAPRAWAGAGDAAGFDRQVQQLHALELSWDTEAEGLAILQQLRAQLPPADAARERMLAAIECGIRYYNDPQAGLKHADDWLARARAASDQVALVHLLLCRGGYAERVVGKQEGLSMAEAALVEARRLEDPMLIGSALRARGGTLSMMGEQARALMDYLEADRRFRAARLDRQVEDNLFSLAMSYRRMGDFQQALTYLGQYEVAATRRGLDYERALASIQVGYVHFEAGDQPKALRSFERAIYLAEKIDDRNLAASARVGVAAALNRMGRSAEALPQLDAAQRQFAIDQDRFFTSMINMQRGIALAQLGRPSQAMPLFDDAEQELVRDDNLRFLSLLYPARSLAWEALGDARRALQDERRSAVVHARLDRTSRNQQVDLMRHQFDASRRERENQRLRSEQEVQTVKLAALERVRRWQLLALVAGAALVTLLLLLGWRQVRTSRRLARMAMTDELTGLANRRKVLQFGETAITRARADGAPLTVLTFDVDYFKRINDSLGHEAGDHALRAIATACTGGLRDRDILGRTGGEEFLVVLPGTPLSGGLLVAERLREAVAALDLSAVAEGLRPSISIGVAELAARDRDLRDLVSRADQALYQAKANGRNRVESASGAHPVGMPERSEGTGAPVPMT